MFNLFLGRSTGGAATAYTLSCESATFAVTATAANLLYDRLLSAESGSYTVTGTDAGLLYARIMAAGSAAYTVTGTDANLEYHRVLVCESGTYLVTVADVGLVFTEVTQVEHQGAGGGGVVVYLKHRAPRLQLKQRKRKKLTPKTIPSVAREAAKALHSTSEISIEEAVMIYTAYF
jgi:hypothetical protein